MASAPATVQYKLPSKGNLGDIKVSKSKRGRRSDGSLRFSRVERPKTATQERQEAAAKLKRDKPLAALGRRVADTRHDNDMYRIGGGAVKNIPGEGRGPGARVNPTISFVKDANGKIVPERKARTLQMRSSPFRRELPSGPPSMTDMPAASIRGARGRMVSNPDYAKWKNNHLEYNSALSRQQMLQPDNRVIQTITPTSETGTAKYPEPITKSYIRRGGNAGPTPSSEELRALNTQAPNIQVV